MCGIAAILAYADDAPQVDDEELRSIRDSMATRGPNGAGTWYCANHRVGLAHRRLSIIDVSSAGHQPMLLHDRNLAVTFNGEIYNYRQLRRILEKNGHRFRSASDTEVLLHLYAEHGEAMVDQLRGMYAFAIWDGNKQSLFLARDPFGIKPLYWADDGKTFRTASQVKSLLAGGRIDTSPEPAGHVGYFLWGHVPEPYTLYRGIRQLPAGHCLTLSIDGTRRLRQFCAIPRILLEAEKTSLNTSSTAERDLRELLNDSISHHLVSDVPIGVFLSAGLDSTSIAALTSQSQGDLRTVTLGFSEFRGTVNDETILAEQVARRYNARHQTIWVTRKDFEHDLQRLFQSMDQPSTDGVNTYFISKAAKQAGLTVALSGVGGDELFGSYPSFDQIPKVVSTIKSMHISQALGAAFRIVSEPWLKRFTSPKYSGLLEYGGDYGGAYLLRRGMFMPWELPEILDGDLVREGWNELQTLARLNDTVNELRSPHLKVSALEMTWYMRNQLLRDTDWASMAHSLEVRVPLVDVDLLRALAPAFTRKAKPTKRDMALTPGLPLPTAILNRPKTGFTVPVRQWLIETANTPTKRKRSLREWTRRIHSIFTNCG